MSSEGEELGEALSRGGVGVRRREGWGAPLSDAMAMLVAMGEGRCSDSDRGLAGNDVERLGSELLLGDCSWAGRQTGESIAFSSLALKPEQHALKWVSYSPSLPDTSPQKDDWSWIGRHRREGKAGGAGPFQPQSFGHDASRLSQMLVRTRSVLISVTCQRVKGG